RCFGKCFAPDAGQEAIHPGRMPTPQLREQADGGVVTALGKPLPGLFFRELGGGAPLRARFERAFGGFEPASHGRAPPRGRAAGCNGGAIFSRAFRFGLFEIFARFSPPSSFRSGKSEAAGRETARGSDGRR